MIRATNAKEFNLGLDAWLASTELEIKEVLRGLAIEAFNLVVETTPQWTGNAAACWNFSVGAPDYSVDTVMLASYDVSPEGKIGAPRFQAGDRPAVAQALARNQGKDRVLASLSQGYYLANAATTDEMYIEMLEENPKKYLRAENDGGQMVAKTVLRMSAKYGSRLSEGEVALLRGRVLGNQLSLF